jgi:GMP synthase (glutamine-hydrolysing)
VIYILDLGSQYTMLIARRIRELGVYSEIVHYKVKLTKLKTAEGIILSGGPHSVYKTKITIDKEIVKLGKPVLGICLGMHFITEMFGGKVREGEREYGRTLIELDSTSKLFHNLPKKIISWMSHRDKVIKLPPKFKVIAKSEEIEIVGFEYNNIYGVQFHPEVVHTEYGERILDNFLTLICKAVKNWKISAFIKEKIELIKKEVGKELVITALSGGVDSTVTYSIMKKAVGGQCIPIFVNTGLLRKGEVEFIKKRFAPKIIKGSEEFFATLKGVTDPEEKRKRIGLKFIQIFEREAKKIKNVKFLAQGTLYPDRIESKSQIGPSSTIKTHHNVGGLPGKMKLKVIEPLKELFKDEVRKVGEELGLEKEIIGRHPFPGPGLAVRIIGEVTPERVSLLQEVDFIYIQELKSYNLYPYIWQAFSILLPIKTVGVMGDKRSYENVVALRAVVSTDGMTAKPYEFEWEKLFHIGNKIIRKVKGINRIVYDITSKPPGTIEWE